MKKIIMAAVVISTWLLKDNEFFSWIFDWIGMQFWVQLSQKALDSNLIWKPGNSKQRTLIFVVENRLLTTQPEAWSGSFARSLWFGIWKSLLSKILSRFEITSLWVWTELLIWADAHFFSVNVWKQQSSRLPGTQVKSAGINNSLSVRCVCALYSRHKSGCAVFP